jgi:hypothetical protein
MLHSRLHTATEEKAVRSDGEVLAVHIALGVHAECDDASAGAMAV